MTTFSQPFAYRRLCTLSAAVALASLAACGGGNDSSPAPAPAPVTPPPPAVSTTVSGAVVKGPVTGAQVCAYTVVGSARGTALGSCTTTDASGNYSFAVPAGTGPLWVEATGGSYTDEVTGATVSVPAGSPLVSLVTANGAAVSTMLTPLTTLALNAARSTAGASGTLDAASYSAAAAQLLSSFNLPSNLNITTTLPAFGAGINSYGTALTTISQMVANGTTLAAILANSNPGALAAAFAAAASPPPVGGGGGGGGGTGPPSASGTLTVSGLASFTPQSTGFQVSLSSASSLRAGYRFFVETQRTVGNATVTDRRELKIDPLTGGGYSVALFDSATREQNLCFSNCAVTFSTPSGASHPVQVSFSNLALSGNRTLNGTLTGDAPGAAWTVADLPGGSTSSLTLNGTAVSVLGSSDSTLDAGGGNTLRAISLRLSDGSTVSLQRNGGTAITVDRVLPPASLAACATACNVSLADGSGTRITFANTPLSGGLVLNGTVDYARTSGSLTTNDALGGFTPVSSTIESLNDTRTLTFNVLGTAAQAGFSLVTVEVKGGRVVRAQATVGIGSQVLSCFDNGTVIGIPACTGVTVAADGRTVTFNNAVLRGGAVGVAARNVTFNGTVAAKGP